MNRGIPCTWMRGGTSKGLYFLKDDLPADTAERNQLLLSIMGSPDPRQINGVGGADPLTSKVAVISQSDRPGVDVDYLFLQVFVDQPIVTDKQNCGNILAGVAQFAIEQGIAEPCGDRTELSVYMVNSDQVAEVTVETPGGVVTYDGDVSIDGVPGTGAPVLENFPEAAGSTCGALLPTGNAVDHIDGVEVTCIDNGMPVVIMAAVELDVTGYESREALDANEALKSRLESIRQQAGTKMNLGDVTDKSVPKMTLVAPARDGGTICTRTFIPHRCHASIGVLGAVSVATACVLPAGPASQYAQLKQPVGSESITVSVEHPIGETSIVMRLDQQDDNACIRSAAILRTARKLFEGIAYYQQDSQPKNSEKI